jgi:nitrous oxidase accessory protein
MISSNEDMKWILVMACFLFSASSSVAKTWTVGPHRAIQTIQSALDHAAAFDSIQVEKGMYKEKTIVISKPVTLIGIEDPIIDGDNKYEIIIITSDNVSISGFAIRHSGFSGYMDIAAIRIVNARKVTIRNNKIDDCFFGIFSQHAVNCLISENQIHSNASSEINSANGIHCWKSDSLNIVGNTISGHRDGIYFEFVTNSLIQGNKSFANVRYGLHFMFSNDDQYVENEFRDNGAGVAVMFSHGVTMLKNHFEDNWGSAAYGLLLKEITDSRIRGNRFVRNTTGIFMEGTARIQVEKNLFKDNGWALRIQASCTDNTIISNNFISNTFDVATNGSLVLNTFNENFWDKYEGYDLNHDGTGDIPYRPVTLYSMLTERNPTTMILFRSFMVSLLDKSEKLMPSVTPENLKDSKPRMKMIR